MPKHVTIKKKIKPFTKVIKVPGDKSLSIRWALLASQAIGKSKAYNLLRSEDVLNTLRGLKRLRLFPSRHRILYSKVYHLCSTVVLKL